MAKIFFTLPSGWWLRFGAGTLLLCFSPAAMHSDAQDVLRPDTPLKELIAGAVKEEIRLIHYDQGYLRYSIHTVDQKGDQVRDVIESKDGTVARILRRDGRALTQEEDSAERSRLQEMLDSPAAFRRHIDKDRSGKQTAIDIIQQLPDAMLFTLVPGQPQRQARPATAPAEYVIDFKPNPAWRPPGITAEVLTGLAGRCWIDPRTHNLTRMETHVFQGVNFGFGIFAHIYPGGEFLVEQQPVEGQRWIVNHFTQHLTLRVLVKTVRQDTDLVATSFVQVPAMSYTDAIHLLLSTPLPATGSK